MPVSARSNSDSFQVTTPSDREIRMTRLFDAPRHLVFEAMSKPEHITRWWGRLGDGYSVPVCEVDLRPGGKWRFSNRTPTGDLATFYGVPFNTPGPGLRDIDVASDGSIIGVGIHGIGIDDVTLLVVKTTPSGQLDTGFDGGSPAKRKSWSCPSSSFHSSSLTASSTAEISRWMFASTSLR